VLLQAGSFGSYRAQIDHNHSLNQNLALRLNVVNRTDNRNFDFNEFKYRGYDATLTYRPFKNTIVRVQGERSGNYRIWSTNNLLIRERAFSGLGFTNRLTVLPNGTVIDNALTATGTPDNTPLGDGTTYLRARDRTNPPGGTGQVLNYLENDVVAPLNSVFTYRGLPEEYAFAGSASVNDREYAVWSAAVEHRFTDKFAMDLAFLQQNQWAHGNHVGSNATGNADVAGRLFTDAGLALTNRRNHMRQYRVSLVYNFDRWKWMQQFFVLRGEYRDDNNVNNGQQQRTFGEGLPVAGVRPFQRVFFTDPYPAAALTEARFFQNAPPGTRLFGTIGAGENHLARAFSLSASGKYLGGRLQTQLGARYDDNFSWGYNQNVPGVTRDPVTQERFSLGDRHSFPELWNVIPRFNQENWTYNAGVVYKITKDINLYYTYSTSYRFGGQSNLILEPTGPLLGTTNEVGLKTSFFKDRLVWNLTAYDLDRENIPTNIDRTGITEAQMDAAINFGLTPDSPDYTPVRTGTTSPDVSTQNSRGFESTFIFYPLSGLSVRLSGAYKEVTFAGAFPVLKQLLAATEARG
ncbi:MAG: TonB-dependent receptor domain-containing protein, partial [Opitutaceae bacterium]